MRLTCQVMQCNACKHIFVWGSYSRPKCPSCPDQVSPFSIRNSDGSVWFTRKEAKALAEDLRLHGDILGKRKNDVWEL